MNRPPAPPTMIVAVCFPGSDKTYDYYTHFPLGIGDEVIVATSRGEATVTVAEIKMHSDRAEKFVLRMADEENFSS